MVSTVDFNVSPYFDDFDPDKKFLRHLFRPGFAVQARELTQIQTILQNQVERFGSHVFEDGSKVIGSDIADQNVRFLRIDPQFDFGGSGLVDLDVNDFIGNQIVSALRDDDTSQTDPVDVLGTLQATCFHAIVDTTEDPFIILFIEYTSTGTLQLTDSSNFVSGENLVEGEIVTGGTSGATATVVAFSAAAVGNPGSRLFLNNISGTFQDGEVVTGATSTFAITIAAGGQVDRTEFQPGDAIVSRDPTDLVTIISKATVKNVDINLDEIQDDFIAVTGDAILASIDRGIFFIDGFFALNDAQRVAPFRLSALDEPVAGAPANARLFTGINARIGFDISKDIVTSDDDSSLLDPSFGSPNFNAPGADRFRIRLLINFKLFEFNANTPQDFADQDFVEWMRIRNDIVVLQKVRPDYSALEDEQAKDIEAIHGSFTVRPFPQDIRPHLKNDLFTLKVSSVLGTFQIGETVTGGTSNASGVVEFITDFDISFLMNSGVFLVAETITQTTGPAASATVDDVDLEEDTKGVFTLSQGGDADSIAFGLEPGKAFVQGFDFETLDTEFVKIDRARDTDELLGFNISTGFGNFLLVEADNTSPPPSEGFDDWNGTFDMDAVPVVQLFSGTTTNFPTATQVGTTRVRQIIQDSQGTYRIYVFDSSFNPGKSMADVREIRDGATTLWLVKDPEGVDANTFNRLGLPGTILFEGETNKLVFQVPVGESTETFLRTDWRSQQQFDVFLNASGIGSVSTTSPKIRFVGGNPPTVTGGELVNYTVINQANGEIVPMNAVGNSIATNNLLPASNGQCTLTVADQDGAGGGALTNVTVTLIATLEVNDANPSLEPLIRRDKVLQQDVVVGPSLQLNGEVILEGDLTDTFDAADVISVTGPTATTSQAASVDLTNPLTATIQFTFEPLGLGPSPRTFIEGETITGATTGAVAKINSNTLLVDAELQNVTGSFIPGEILFEGGGASPAPDDPIAIAITPTQWRIISGMFTDNGLVKGLSSGEQANIQIDPALGLARSTFTAAIFDYDNTTTTGVLRGQPVGTPEIASTSVSSHDIRIQQIIQYRGNILRDVTGDASQHIMRVGDEIVGSTSNATATIREIVLTASLDKIDLYGLEQITDDGNANVDVLEAFFADDGQRDNFYDFASIEYNNQSGVAIVGPFTVTINHFDHTGDGPLYVNSYTHSGSNIRFENIGNYTSLETGDTVSLRDVVDYRPIRNIAGNFDKVFLPKNQEAFDADYRFHLPRIDKIILRKERRFDVIRGIPSLEAETPPDDPQALTLYVVKLPPFTYNAEDVEARYIENKRYTMSDIGDIDRRVERLEYYTSLTLLEQETEALNVPDASGEDRFKNGIIVDSFQGHNVGDVLNPDYDISIDFERGELRPPFIDRPLILEELTDNGFVTISGDGIVTLNFTEEALVFQPLASTAISVNPFNVVNWMGCMTIAPSSDTWIDVNQRPELRVNLEGENDAWQAITRAANLALPNGFGTQWGSWETQWTGRTVTQRNFDRSTSRVTRPEIRIPIRPRRRRFRRGFVPRRGTVQPAFRIVLGRPQIETTTQTIERTTITTRGRQTRTGIQTRVVPERIERSLGNRVVDVSIIPFIRPRDGLLGNQAPLVINAENMKPNTRVFPFFDNVEVSEFSRPQSGALGDRIETDAAGKVVNMEFEIPQGRFRTGERLFRLTDEPANIVANALTTSERTWNAQGLLQTREEAIVSTRVPVFRRQSVTQTRPARNVRTRDRVVRTQTRVRWFDPLAQTFLVDSNLHENGVFLTSVDLFFRDKPEDLPITVQIRPVVNGVPHSSAIIPFSEVVLEPSQVNTSETPDPSDSNTVTTFTFSSPVHLEGGQEYALVVLSNSDDYLLYIATIGQNQLGTEDRISTQPYAGSLFRSQNASTWTPDQTSDMMFSLNRAVFDTVNTGEINFKNIQQSPVVPDTLPDEAFVNEMYLISEQLEFPESELNLSVQMSLSGNLAGALFVPILANNQEKFTVRNKVLVTDATESFVVKAQFISNDDAISPVMDKDRLTAIIIENRVNDALDTNLQSSNYNGELEPRAFEPQNPDTGVGRGPIARYITRLVTLEPGFESNDLRVFLTVNKQLATEVQVFVKVQTPEEEGEFENERFIQLNRTKNPISENDEDFREIEFELPLPLAEPFNKFVVKVTLYSFDKGITVPKVRDLRAIAVI